MDDHLQITPAELILTILLSADLMDATSTHSLSAFAEAAAETGMDATEFYTTKYILRETPTVGYFHPVTDRALYPIVGSILSAAARGKGNPFLAETQKNSGLIDLIAETGIAPKVSRNRGKGDASTEGLSRRSTQPIVHPERPIPVDGSPTAD